MDRKLKQKLVDFSDDPADEAVRGALNFSFRLEAMYWFDRRYCMAVGLPMDQHVPGAITRGLLVRGADVPSGCIRGSAARIESPIPCRGRHGLPFSK